MASKMAVKYLKFQIDLFFWCFIWSAEKTCTVCVRRLLFPSRFNLPTPPSHPPRCPNKPHSPWHPRDVATVSLSSHFAPHSPGDSNKTPVSDQSQVLTKSTTRPFSGIVRRGRFSFFQTLLQCWPRVNRRWANIAPTFAELCRLTTTRWSDREPPDTTVWYGQMYVKEKVRNAIDS